MSGVGKSITNQNSRLLDPLTRSFDPNAMGDNSLGNNAGSILNKFKKS